MLVLTRKLMEKLYIGGDICITVVRLEGSQVRLGIEAPRHVPVVRAELTRHPRPEQATTADDPSHQVEPARIAVGQGPAYLPARPLRVRARTSQSIGETAEQTPPAPRDPKS